MGSFKCLGGFRNIRDEYDYEGFVLELDETIFPWGTVYEIEVETVRGDESEKDASQRMLLQWPCSASLPP